MQLGIDARELEGSPTGVGRVLRGLVTAWPRDDKLILYSRLELDPRITIPPCENRVLTAPHWLPGTLWEQTRLPKALQRDRPAALLSPAYGMPACAPCPVVVGMHDCAVEAFPSDFNFRQRWRRRLLARLAARRASFLFCGSRFASHEMMRWYGIGKDRARVVPYGVSDDFRPPGRDARKKTRQQFHLKGPLVLLIGARLRRRWLPIVTQALVQLRTKRPEIELAAAGTLPVNAQVGEMGHIDHTVRWLGYIPEEELPNLLGTARVVLYPSQYEGFGLPVLEAMACGAPVVTSAVGSLAEIYAGRAELIDPAAGPEAWVSAIVRLLDEDDVHARAVEGARAWAAAHRWELAAAEVRALMVKAVRACKEATS